MPGLATSGSASLLSASGQIASSSRRGIRNRRELVVVVERNRAFHRQVRQPHLRLLQLDGAAIANDEDVAQGGCEENKIVAGIRQQITSPQEPAGFSAGFGQRQGTDLRDLNLAEYLTAGAWFRVDAAEIAANVLAPEVVIPSSGGTSVLGHQIAGS